MELTLLVSSLSAHGSALRIGPEVMRTLRQTGWDVSVRILRSFEDVRDVAGTVETPYVAALGGDGFLAQVASGVLQSGAIMLPLPGGRGNDLCRALGIGTDPIQSVKNLPNVRDSQALHQRLRTIDVLAVREEGHEPRFALGIISMGIDAAANKVANESTWIKHGSLAYAWGAVASLMRFKPGEISARIDGEEVALGGWLTSISNSGWFGGGINIVPTSVLDDGRVEVINVEGLPLWKALPTLARVLTTRSEDSAISLREATTVEITGPEGTIAMADGDVIAHVPFTVTVLPGALKVMM